MPTSGSCARRPPSRSARPTRRRHTVVAESDEPPLVVMTDVGSGPSVAAALRGDDAAVGGGRGARVGARRWDACTGRRCGERERFRAALGQRSGRAAARRVADVDGRRPGRAPAGTAVPRPGRRAPLACAARTARRAAPARRRPRRCDQPGRRVPRGQRVAGRPADAGRLRGCAVAPHRLGRRLPDGAVADLLVLVADARRRRRPARSRATGSSSRPSCPTSATRSSGSTLPRPRWPGRSSRRRGSCPARSTTRRPTTRPVSRPRRAAP